jgi:membrane associated rhomboid family serine protease
MDRFGLAWAVAGTLGYFVLIRAFGRYRGRNTAEDWARVRRLVPILVVFALLVGFALDRLAPIATVLAAAIASGFLAGAVAAKMLASERHRRRKRR